MSINVTERGLKRREFMSSALALSGMANSCQRGVAIRGEGCGCA